MEAGAHVTVIEMMDKILGPNDREISAVLQKEMQNRGMEIILSAAVGRIGRDRVFYSRDGRDAEAAFDKVLMCVGRRPNTDIDGLKETGVAMERGAIAVDECMRTSIANMYAVGDVNARLMLAHVGYRQGEVAVNDILGKKDSMSYAAICGVVYTQPEAAFVGYSEEAAGAAGLDIDVRKASINFSGRHIAENGMSNGLCKLLIDRKRDTIVGAAVLSSYASEYIYALALMIENKIPVASIKRTVFPHPTVCEIIREALL
jgi:dihydrolipoamide dehydrogenase